MRNLEMMTQVSAWISDNSDHISLIAVSLAVCYFALVQALRYRRKAEIEAPFASNKRPLSSMTTEEAHDIVAQLQLLEFPYAFEKARKIALLKAGGIPTMSKLFAVTGQNNKRNAGKRAIDTQILLREAQSQLRDSDRYATAVARMNYLHARYRRANKITDLDLLHTLGDGLGEIFKVVQREEWRQFTDVEKCAIGVFHKNLGDDMEILFAPLPHCREGWNSGLQFAEELAIWTHQYEQEVARPVTTNEQYVRVYVDSAVSKMPKFVATTVRKVLAESLDDTMRVSLWLEPPGFFLSTVIKLIRILRITYLRYMALPRLHPIKLVAEKPNPGTTLYNFDQLSFQPWYVKPSFWASWGTVGLLLRAFGGKVPGWSKEKYQPQGYDLMTIGPDPQKGKGVEEMLTAVSVIKAKGIATCPFSQGLDS